MIRMRLDVSILTCSVSRRIVSRGDENEIATLSTEVHRATSTKPYPVARPRGINRLPVLSFGQDR